MWFNNEIVLKCDTFFKYALPLTVLCFYMKILSPFIRLSVLIDAHRDMID